MQPTSSFTSVRSTGAVGDGVANDHPAIQRALDQHRQVYIPFGTYLINGTLRIQSGTTLLAHPLARIIHGQNCATRQDDFLLTNAQCWNPTSDSKELDRDITIAGGIWDGNVGGNKRSGDHEYGYSGVLIHFAHLTNFRMHDVVLRNSNAYYFRIGWAKNFLIQRVEFQMTKPSPNQDGIHLGGHCEDGVVEDIFAHGLSTPNDDMVAINADDAIFRPECNGVPCGPIRRIRVQRIRADDCHSFVRFASFNSEISDIDVRDVEGGCQICAVNIDALRYCRTPMFKDTDPGRENGVGAVNNIQLSDFRVWKTAKNDAALLRLESRMNQFQVDRFERLMWKDVCPELPTIRVRHVPASVRLQTADGQSIEKTLRPSDSFEHGSTSISHARILRTSN
jgi:polygalacturonase